MLFCSGTPNPQRLQKCLKSLRNPKIRKQNFVFNIFKGFTGNKICSLSYLKAKNKEKVKKV